MPKLSPHCDARCWSLRPQLEPSWRQPAYLGLVTLTDESNTNYNTDFPRQSFEQNWRKMSRCLPHLPGGWQDHQGPSKQGHQRELGTPSLAPAPAYLPLANQGNHAALLADHVDRPHVQHAIGVAVGDAVHENRHWQHKGAGRLHNWVVPVGTEQGTILACLLEFEWHCGGFMYGHRWHIVHGAGQVMPLVASEAAFLSHACPRHVPLAVLAPSTWAQSQARNVPLNTWFRCPPKFGADNLGAGGRDVPRTPQTVVWPPDCNHNFSGGGIWNSQECSTAGQSRVQTLETN